MDYSHSLVFSKYVTQVALSVYVPLHLKFVGACYCKVFNRFWSQIELLITSRHFEEHLCISMLKVIINFR